MFEVLLGASTLMLEFLGWLGWLGAYGVRTIADMDE